MVFLVGLTSRCEEQEEKIVGHVPIVLHTCKTHTTNTQWAHKSQLGARHDDSGSVVVIGVAYGYRGASRERVGEVTGRHPRVTESAKQLAQSNQWMLNNSTNNHTPIKKI